jgi:ubiquinone/menaquinone biosynthesis C-methylase UbiE
VTKDWHEWHAHYDDPASSLSRRLEVVRECLSDALAELTPRRDDGGPRLLSMCAGDGRDTLPVLAAAGRDVRAVLVEIDEQLSATARTTAAELGLDGVEVRTADAGSTDAYEGAGRVDVLMACGVFGNVTDADIEQTIGTLPMLLRPGALVIWTRGRHANDVDPSEYEGDPSEKVRRLFVDAGYEEINFVRPDDAGFRIGVHRFSGPAEPYAPGRELFTFV